MVGKGSGNAEQTSSVEEAYFDALKSVSSSTLGGHLDKFAKEEEKILMKQNFAVCAEKVAIVESRLPMQLDFAKKEVVRMFLQSEEFEKDASELYAVVVNNTFNLCKAQVRTLLDEDDELITDIENLQPALIKGFVPKALPDIKRHPTLWTEDFSTDPLEFVSELKKDLAVPPEVPPPVSYTIPTSLPQSSSVSKDSGTTPGPSNVDPTPPPPQTSVSEDKTV
ncbi:hypothetical protein Dimus_016290 [Dionaea muscipula]